jgi:hypothetical protein
VWPWAYRYPWEQADPKSWFLVRLLERAWATGLEKVPEQEGRALVPGLEVQALVPEEEQMSRSLKSMAMAIA